MKTADGHTMLRDGPDPVYTCSGCACRARFWRDSVFPYSHVQILDPGDGTIHHIAEHYFYEPVPGQPATG